MSTCTETLYIQSASSLLEKLTRIGQIIEALEIRYLEYGVANSDIDGYSLDDGQVKISTTYRDPETIVMAIGRFERIYQMTLNKLNGRSMALRPWQGLR